MKKSIRIDGKTYPVRRSNRKDKKFRIDTATGPVHFGARGARISPGTAKGDRYCTRSFYIKDSPGIDPNDASRAMWRCRGKKSL